MSGLRERQLFAIYAGMFVLGIDTALDACSVALLKGNEVVVDKFTPLAKGHAETIAVLVRNALDDAGLRVRDLERIGVVVGPGGFAGARAGLSFVQGLSVGAEFGGRPLTVVGVDSFRAVYHSHCRPSEDTPAAIAIDARRGQVYLAAYDSKGQTLLEGCAVDIEDAAPLLRTQIRGELALFGSGADLIAETEPTWRAIPGSDQISAVAVARIAAAAEAPFTPVAPIYLRAPDAKRSAAGLFAALLDRK